MAPLGPEPEIVGKLKNLNFLFFFLKLNSFCDAPNSVIFFLSKFFFTQNKYFVSAAPSDIWAILIFSISFLFLIALKR